MKTLITYFTGTGNSLFVAKKVAENIPNSKLLSITKIMREKIVFTDYTKIIIIYPVYYCGLPLIVENFFRTFDFSRFMSIYYICTSGDDGGLDCSTSKIRKHLLKHNKTLSGGFNISMPGNYIKMYDQKPQELVNRKLSDASPKIDKVISQINKDIENNKRDIYKLVSLLVNDTWQKKVNQSDKQFNVSLNCNSCSICFKVCPVSNIQMINGKPVWNKLCEECLACVHFCPQKAINTKKTVNKRRYHHPQISVNEIINNK